MSQTLQSVLCITTNIYLVRVLVVLLHALFSVVSPIPFLLAAIFFPVHPYIGSTTVLPDIWKIADVSSMWGFAALAPIIIYEKSKMYRPCGASLRSPQLGECRALWGERSEAWYCATAADAEAATYVKRVYVEYL